MCDDAKDIEKFVKENMEEIERILKAQKSSFKEKTEQKKEKAEEMMKSFASLFFSPDIQRHFVRAGIEFLSGVDELIRSAPMPGFVKETMEHAHETKETIKDEVKKDADAKNKAAKPDKDKKIKKIDVE